MLRSSTKVENRSKICKTFITYNKTLPNVKQIINKHWHLLLINSNLLTAFEKEPIIAYRRNKNLGDLTGNKMIK